jgi:hypothetical protein
MKLVNFKNLLFFSVCLILLFSLVLYLPLQGYKVFESPDENANYLTTKLYAEKGQFWYAEDYTELDVENYLHPRHFVTHQGRIVPTEFLGLPVIYGPLYLIAGDKAAIIWVAVFSLISFIFFVKLAGLLFGEKLRSYAALLFFANLPLLFHFSLPYFNAAGSITFFILCSFYLAKFYHLNSNKDLFLTALFFSLSIFFRYDYAIFVGLLFIIVMVNKYKGKLHAYVKPVLMSVLIIALVALAPILVLNYEVYGHPMNFGYNLLEVQSIGREPTSIWQFLLPNPVIANIVLTNVYRLTIRLLPLLTLLSIVGLIFYIKVKKLSGYKILYGLLFVYILVYSGSSDTWNAYNLSYIGFNVSIIRYWLIDYVFLALMAVQGFTLLVEKHRKLLALFILAMIVTSVNVLFISTDRSLLKFASVGHNNQKIAETVKATIYQNSIIYSDSYDKIFEPLGIKTANWWGREEVYDSGKLTVSMNRVYFNTDYSVYLYAPSSYIDVEVLNDILKDQNLFLESSQEIKYLYKLKEISP